MPTCLYCGQERDSAAFNREHVLQDAFGRYEPASFVLTSVVCADCNQYFGDHLDRQLARDTIEGLDRYETELRRPLARTEFGRSNRLKARVNDGGFYHGAEVRWGPSEDRSRLGLYPIPQFGISDGAGRQLWFRQDELPLRDALPSHGITQGAELTIKPFGIAKEDADRLLTEKGYAPTSFDLVNGPPEGSEIDINITGSIDDVLSRAIAKIAFNYLAYNYEGVARMPQFDAIRRYIRYAESPPWPPVSLSNNDFLAGLPRDQVPVAHGIGVSLKGEEVFGQVTLFFRFHYRVAASGRSFRSVPMTVASPCGTASPSWSSGWRC